MAKKISSNIEQNSSSNNVFNWDIFISNICKGDYVLVVGSGIILDKNQNVSAHGDSRVMLLQLLIEQLKKENVLADGFNCENFSDLSRVYANVKGKLLETMTNNVDYSLEEIYPHLKELLATRCFRIVLTTTFDPYLEMAMREVWGDELRVMDIYSNGGGYDINQKEKNGREFYAVQPTLYYVFGKAKTNTGENEQKFVLTDNDTMECIAKWLGVSAPRNLIEYIKHKRLLSIGCKLDDWCFRFFWYALRKNTNINNGDIAIALNTTDSESDRNLYNYLLGQKIHIEKNTHEFITSIINRLNIDERAKMVREASQLGGVFISYANEDFSIAQYIFSRLREKGIDVWLDYPKLTPSDEYDERIRRSIQECKVFLPILSGVTKNDLKESNNRYYMKEWEWASGVNSDKKIFPITVTGYDKREFYHDKLPEKINKSTVFDWQKQPMEDIISNISNIIKEFNQQ